MKLSYLNLTTTDPTINLATEQYVFEQLPKDRTYFMLWQNDNAIIIGKHQNTLAEINEKYVKENNISVVRRLSGGGAVYHDLGNLNFTFITDANKQANIDFHLFCQPIVKTLKSIGIHAEINGRNDITIDGKKFSGNSQLIRDGRVLHHGTILFQSDLTIVGKALQVNAEKIQAKGVKSVRSRVTNVSEHLTERISLKDFRKLLLENILASQNGEEYILSDKDTLAIEEIANHRYRTWQWNYGSCPQCTMMKKSRIEGCGTIEAYITLKHGVISEMTFMGDFFSAIDPALLAEKFIGLRPEYNIYKNVLQNIDISKYFAGLTTEDFLKFITQ